MCQIMALLKTVSVWAAAFSELLIFEVTETDRELSTVGAWPGRCGEAL